MKKKIPLAILEALEPIVDNNLKLTTILKTDNTIFHLIDKDENSDFYFKVTKQEIKNSKPYYLAEYKPTSKDNVNAYSAWLTAEGITDIITKWLELLQAYDEIRTIYDDPIIKGNQQRFEKQFDILDEDADIMTFDLPQQIFLDDYLTNVKSKLLTLHEGKNKNQIKELEDLTKEVTEIQNDLTKQTKRQIIIRLSKFWAKAQKTGLDVIKEVFVNVMTELAKKLITGG